MKCARCGKDLPSPKRNFALAWTDAYTCDCEDKILVPRENFRDLCILINGYESCGEKSWYLESVTLREMYRLLRGIYSKGEMLEFLDNDDLEMVLID